MQSSIYYKKFKRNNGPLYGQKRLLFKFSLMSEEWRYVMGWGQWK
jgi:hypothetical protein